MEGIDMFELLKARLALYNIRMMEFGTVLSESASIDDFYSNSITYLLLYAVYIAKVDGELDEDEYADILEAFSAIPSLKPMVSDTIKSFSESSVEVIKMFLWNKIDYWIGCLAMLVLLNKATKSDVESILAIFIDFANVIIASNGAVDYSEKMAREEFENYFAERYNHYINE